MEVLTHTGEKSMAKLSIRKMLESGVHFGHRSRFWHPKMAPYIFGIRNKIHIINLETTLPLFKDALNYAGKVAASGGEVLFVGTKRSGSNAIKEQAIRCGMPYVNHRWLGGMLTNYKTIRSSIKRLQDLEFLAEENFSQFSKKESLMMTREMEKLERSLGGIKNMNGIPSTIFVIDIGFEKNAVNEARTLKLPVIGVVDTNHCPDNIDYIIPGNDDSIRSIELYASEMADAIITAKEAAPKVKAENKKAKITVSDKKKEVVKVQKSKEEIAKTIKEEAKPESETIAPAVEEVKTVKTVEAKKEAGENNE
jgi:small subunit ribosomal protein S2